MMLTTLIVNGFESAFEALPFQAPGFAGGI
jgi:hypothetical protein